MEPGTYRDQNGNELNVVEEYRPAHFQSFGGIYLAQLSVAEVGSGCFLVTPETMSERGYKLVSE